MKDIFVLIWHLSLLFIGAIHYAHVPMPALTQMQTIIEKGKSTA